MISRFVAFAKCGIITKTILAAAAVVVSCISSSSSRRAYLQAVDMMGDE